MQNFTYNHAFFNTFSLQTSKVLGSSWTDQLWVLDWMNTYLNTCLWFVDGYRFPMQHISFTWTGQHFFKQRRWKQQFCTPVLTGWQICAVTRYIGNLKATSCSQKLTLLVSAAKYLFVNLISVNLLSVCPFCLSKWWTRSASQIRTRFSNILCKLKN